MAIVYLRELPEPLFTNEKENVFAESLMDIKDEQERIQKYRELLSTIPELNARSRFSRNNRFRRCRCLRFIDVPSFSSFCDYFILC